MVADDMAVLQSNVGLSVRYCQQAVSGIGFIDNGKMGLGI